MAKKPNKQAPAAPAAPAPEVPIGWVGAITRFKSGPMVAAIVFVGGAVLGVMKFFGDVGDAWDRLLSKPQLQDIVKQLVSDTGEQRLAALSLLKDYDSRKPNDVQLALTALQESMSRRASRELKSGDASAASRRETTMAMQAMSHLLRQAKDREMKLERPRLVNLNLAELDLSGLYLGGTDWQDVDAHGARLVAADLSGARLDGVQLSLVDATKVNLKGATLRRVCLESAVLDEAKLSEAHIDMSDFNAASLQLADLSAAVVMESRMNGTKLNGAVLSRADLRTVLEWLPQQAQQAGAQDATALPVAYRQLKSGICG